MTRRRCGVLIALVVVLSCVLDVRAVEAQCTYSVSPTTVSAPSTGLNSSISVITGSSCAWTPVSSVPWITITSGGMSGLGSFSYTVAATATPRTGTITVAGQTVTINQSTGSCTYSVSPTNVSAPSTGLNSSISVITGSACAWTPASSVLWITVTSGGMSGLGSFSYTVAPNGTGAGRTGTLTVGGQIVTVTQSTGSCTYSVSPTSVSAPSTGLNSSISVVTGSGCAWTATSSATWIAITSGGMSGLGSVNYTVAATTTARTGTITVAGQTITITQIGGQPPAAPANLRIVIVS
jgi:Putative binding domain, N-terminal